MFPEILRQHKSYLLTGVSYVVPVIACGGILTATAIAFAPMTTRGPDFSGSPTLKLIADVGAAAFALALPVLAGFIAQGVAGRPGLVPGLIGGFIANQPFSVVVGGQAQESGPVSSARWSRPARGTCREPDQEAPVRGWCARWCRSFSSRPFPASSSAA